MAKYFRTLAMIVVMTGVATSSHAAVEYVKVCSLFGAGFYYVPGTDTCLNPMTGETRQATEGGVWFSHLPSNPGSWIPSPRAGCKKGRLVKIATTTANNFTLNAYAKYDTPLVPLPLASGEYVANVIMRGGFNITSRSSFCLSFFDSASGAYSLLGCEDTALAKDRGTTWMFTPLRSVPPSSFTGAVTLVGNNSNERWSYPLPAFDGAVESWVCVQSITDKE